MTNSFKIYIPPSNSQTISGVEKSIVSSRERKELRVVCPICSRTFKIRIPSKAILEPMKGGGITSVSVHASCKHRFVIFIDKGFKIRGYQTVEFHVKTDEEIEKIKCPLP